MKLSDREWEALSAYLDGQLAAKEKTRLEERLQKSSDLRSALEELRRTQAVLRSQPKMRAPRNFTLTPEMVGARRPSNPFAGAFTFLRLASAMASVLLILVVIGDLFTGVSSAPTAMSGETQVAQLRVLEAAPAGEAGEIPLEEAPAEAAPEGEVMRQQADEVPLLAPEATGSPAIAAEAVEEPAAEEPQAGMMVQPSEEAAADASAMRAGEGEAQPEAAPPQAAAQEETGAAKAESLEEARAASPWLTSSVWRALEIGLAIIALTTGLAALWLRRVNR